MQEEYTLGRGDKLIILQTFDEDGVAESPYLIEGYCGSGCLGIKQGDSKIIVSLDGLKDFIKVLNKVAKTTRENA